MTALVEFVEYVQSLGREIDTRHQGKVKHKCGVVVVLALIANMCGFYDCVAMAEFAENYFDTLSKRIPMETPPSHDTFSRVLGNIETTRFGRLLAEFQKEIGEADRELIRRLIAIDGKTARGSRLTEKAYDQQRAAHIVSGYDHANGTFMGQVLTDVKSNEITAIPRLLNTMGDISGAIVTIDAMGTQFKIAQNILSHGADYCLALKGNQSSMADDVELFVESESADDTWETHEYTSQSHVMRKYDVYNEAEWLDRDRKETWGIKSIATATTIVDGEIFERRAFVLSTNLSAEEAGKVIRGHWMIESLHWHLDNQCREDESQVKNHQLIANLSALKKIAVLSLKKMSFKVRKGRGFVMSSDLSIVSKQRRLLASLPEFLEQTLG